MPINYSAKVKEFKVNLSYKLHGEFKGILGYMGPCLKIKTNQTKTKQYRVEWNCSQDSAVALPLAMGTLRK